MYFLLFCVSLVCFRGNAEEHLAKSYDPQHFPPWIVNYPQDLFESPPTGELLDVRSNEQEIKHFTEVSDKIVWTFEDATDGEIVDAIEQFFWGKKNGLSLELGALDGSPKTCSMTFELENSFGWRRILIEGNPNHRSNLKTRSSRAISINAAICQHHQKVHFGSVDYVGGIIEFMTPRFLSDNYKPLYQAGRTENGSVDLSRIHWNRYPHIHEIYCIPLHTVFSELNVSHINFFILDVEGGELEVLSSIHWHQTTFDVIVIETDPQNRPPGYAERVVQFMKERGYRAATRQLGRNIWFMHQGYEASVRPGLGVDCFNGHRKFENMVERNAGHPVPFQLCQNLKQSSLRKNIMDQEEAGKN